jgi:hypothetical protein
MWWCCFAISHSGHDGWNGSMKGGIPFRTAVVQDDPHGAWTGLLHFQTMHNATQSNTTITTHCTTATERLISGTDDSSVTWRTSFNLQQCCHYFVFNPRIFKNFTWSLKRMKTAEDTDNFFPEVLVFQCVLKSWCKRNLQTRKVPKSDTRSHGRTSVPSFEDVHVFIKLLPHRLAVSTPLTNPLFCSQDTNQFRK